MSRSLSHLPNTLTHQMVTGIMERGQLTPQEYLLLTSAFISNFKLSQQMKQEINQVLDALQMGRLKLVDT